jgi:hypothetical protein
MGLIANEDFARVFNNYVSKGIHESPVIGGVYNGLLRTANFTTSVQLGISAFHASTMLKESFYAAMADATRDAFQGKLGSAAKRYANSWKAPYTYFKMGDDLVNAYNELSDFGISPKLERIADLAARANMRLGDLDEVYRASAMGNYFQTIVRSLKTEGITGLREAAKRPLTTARETAGAISREAQQFGRELKETPVSSSFSMLGRVIESAAYPLFYHYIPRIKAGVFMDRMSAWLEHNPIADEQRQVEAAQRIADVIDDQFGELVQNNVFWQAHLKQTSNLLLTSTGWTLGTLRLFGQGAGDIAKGLYNIAKPGRADLQGARDLKPIAGGGYAPKRLQPLTDRAAYTLVAGTIGAVTMGAVYLAIKTAINAALGIPLPDAPESFKDFVAPKTGGKNARGDDERVILPGYEKDILGWYHAPKQEAYNKLGPLPKTTLELLRNKDWRDDPVYGTDSIGQFISGVGQRIVVGNAPISISAAATPTSPRTQNFGLERFMGIRAAGGWVTNPSHQEAIDRYYGRKREQTKTRHERRDKQRSEAVK